MVLVYPYVVQYLCEGFRVTCKLKRFVIEQVLVYALEMERVDYAAIFRHQIVIFAVVKRLKLIASVDREVVIAEKLKYL